MSVLTLRKRIIYDTHGANIYINICTTKIFIEKVKNDNQLPGRDKIYLE